MGLYINNTKMGMPYINGIKHNAYINGNKIWIVGPSLAPADDGEFSFTVQDNGSFEIPTSGANGSSSSYQSYDWIIDWGDGVIETKSGTGSVSSTIPHTYSDGKNTHKIKIHPSGSITQGWFNAFGSKIYANKTNNSKIKSINSVITEKMKTMNSHSHNYMFCRCSGLTTVPTNLLPATTLANNCYNGMFMECTSLTNFPELLATTLATHCYDSMFYGCTSLTSIPSNLLPVTTLATYCYFGMFRGCTGLTSIPSNLLPATTLVTHCYNQMFFGTRLTTLPSDLLPATTLANHCYTSMFQNCSVLTDIGNIDANWFFARSSNPQSSMFNNCTNITTPITYADIPTEWK